MELEISEQVKSLVERWARGGCEPDLAQSIRMDALERPDPLERHPLLGLLVRRAGGASALSRTISSASPAITCRRSRSSP